MNDENKSLKIKYLKFTILIIISLFFISCTSLSKLGINEYPPEILSKNNYYRLNGNYLESHDTICGKLEHLPYAGFDELETQSLICQLFLSIPETYYRDDKGEIIKSNEKWVKIEFLSNKKAILSMYHKDKFVFSKTIHGKFKNGYFYLRPKMYVIPLIPIVFGYSFQRARIGLSGEDLLIDYSVNMWGFALFGGSSDKGYTSSVYRKKK
jgi:hypothetical protein